jgi:hypothetical protein
MGRRRSRPAGLAAVVFAVGGLAACGGGSSSSPRPAQTTADAVELTCGQGFEPTAEMRRDIVRGKFVDIGPLTLLDFRELASRLPIGDSSLKVVVIATPGASVTVTIDPRDRARAGFLRFYATDVDPLPIDAKPEFRIDGCSRGSLARRSRSYEMTWAVATPGCVHFTVTEVGVGVHRAAMPFGGKNDC